ncbi:hypothetical protein KAR91_32580 [Candidatus Pacearchaeota archaeon]|nr:hypothetical protein [Candidatus Pacearchaeota archaeon]
MPYIRSLDDDMDVLCLGDCPTENAASLGKPIQPSGMTFLEGTVSQISASYAIDNVVRCHMQRPLNKKELERVSSGEKVGRKDATVKTKETDACKRTWQAVIQKHNPKVIVSLGPAAINTITNGEVGGKKSVGQIIKVNIRGVEYPVIISHHPDKIVSATSKFGGGERILDNWISTWELVEAMVKKGVGDAPDTRSLTEPKEILGFINWLTYNYKGMVGYDYETWGNKSALRPELCSKFKILSIGIGVDVDEGESGISFLFDTLDKKASRELSVAWQGFLKKAKSHPDEIQLVCQNAKYEHKCNLRRFEFTVQAHDTMLAMNVINELASANLGAIGGYCQIPWSGYKLSMKDAQKAPDLVSKERLLRYSGLEGDITLKIWHILKEKVAKLKRTSVLSMQESFAFHLAHVEVEGMHVNKETVRKVRNNIDRLLEEAMTELLKDKYVKKTEKWAEGAIKSFKVGNHFNPNSTDQVKHLILTELKLPIKANKHEKNKDGSLKRSTDKDALEPYKEKYPAVAKLIAVRSYKAMKTGFLDKYDEFTGLEGCIHTNYTQVVAVTSRLTSVAPNLQNIPTDSIVRSVFDSRFEGGYLLASDYVQLEPVLLAGWSGDIQMCKALNEGLDLHRFVGSQVYDVEYNVVTGPQRWVAKRRNLGSMYGQTVGGLAEAAGITMNEAQRVVDIYDKKFPKVKQFRLDRGAEAIKFGEVKDLFGGTRHLRNATNPNKAKQARALRQAGNFPIQSTGNRFHLIAMCLLRKRIIKLGMDAVVIGVEHDKILVDTPPQELTASINLTVETMLVHNTAAYWRDKPVPIKVDVKYGHNLGDMKKWELD